MKRIASLIAVAGLAVVLLAVVPAAQSGGKGKKKRGRMATAALKGADGSAVAKVRLVERRRDSVTVSVHARGLSPGFHGFHIHGKGSCDPPDFSSAGGHHHGEGQGHGAHAGDMPPLLATRDGEARAMFVTDGFRISELVAEDGSAIMIHAGRDNLANIPTRYASGATTGPDEEMLGTGDSGSRFACGVVQTKRH